MDDGRTWLLPILILACAFTFYTAMALSALTHLSDVTLRDKAEEGDQTAKLLDKLLDSGSYYLDNVRTLSSFFGALSAILAGWWLYGLSLGWAEALWSHLLGESLLELIASVFTLLIVSILFIVLLRKLPGRLGKKMADSFAFKSLSFTKGMTAVLSPLCWVIRVLSWGVGSLFGIRRGEEVEADAVTEEDIRLMVDTGSETGAIEKSQQEMIENIFEFDDNTAGDVMTHRTDVTAVESDATVTEAAKLAVETGFSRLPVYEKDMDNIIGVLYAKDLLRLLDGGKKDGLDGMPITGFIRPILYIPESTACRALFAKFKSSKTHIAVVADEYGGTAGIVCMEDILESIVGDIEDEYDPPEVEVRKLKDDDYILNGTIELDELNEMLSIEITEDEDYDTLGGFITHTLGFLPDPGTHPYVDFGGWRFTVVRIDDRRVDLVRAVPTPGGVSLQKDGAAEEPKKEPPKEDHKPDKKEK